MGQIRRVRPAGHGSVMFNLRLKPERGRSTASEREAAMEKLLDSGKAPSGWKMAAIEWAHPSKGSVRWVRGGEADLDKFLPLMRDVGLSNLRMAKVETGATRAPTKRERAAVKRLEKAVRSAGAAQMKAQRALGRSKTAATRARWRKISARERERRLGFTSDLLELYERFEPEDEYEVAVDYRKKGRR